MGKSNPNLTERQIDDLYILNVKDYESMNIVHDHDLFPGGFGGDPQDPQKDGLIPESKSVMEYIKNHKDLVRDRKMRKKEQLRTNNPYLIEREIDDLYNKEKGSRDFPLPTNEELRAKFLHLEKYFDETNE
jgi:hypothetical protein